MTTRHSAPIYLECYLDRSDMPSRNVLDETMQLQLDNGAWFCRLHAPNGARTTVTVPGSSEPRSYQHFAKILRKAVGGGDLWMTPSAGNPQGPPEAVNIGAWSGEDMLSRQDWSLQPRLSADKRWLMVSPNRKEDRIDFLQILIDDVSMFVRCPPTEDLEFQCERTNSEYSVRPVFTTSDADVSAYWGFTRHAIAKGAFSIGERIARSSRIRQISPAQAVVAAHWAVSFGIDDVDYLEPVGKRLAELPDNTDALIMKWVLDLGRAQPEKRQEVRRRFWLVAEAALSTLPTFTGSVRLLCERLPDDPYRLGADVPDDGRGKDILDRLWLLASAMAWDTEHTSFRGYGPDKPDPKAGPAHIDAGSKKKFAGQSLSS